MDGRRAQERAHTSTHETQLSCHLHRNNVSLPLTRRPMRAIIVLIAITMMISAASAQEVVTPSN